MKIRTSQIANPGMIQVELAPQTAEEQIALQKLLSAVQCSCEHDREKPEFLRVVSFEVKSKLS